MKYLEMDKETHDIKYVDRKDIDIEEYIQQILIDFHNFIIENNSRNT